MQVHELHIRPDAADALRRRDGEFREIVEAAPDLIARFDKDLRHIYVNPALCRAIRLDATDVLGKTHTELGHPKGNAVAWESWVREVFETGRERVATFEQVDELGYRFYHARIIPQCDERGEPVTVLAIVRDISERRRNEELQAFLAEAGKRLSATLDVQETVETIADLAVPMLADLCAVDLINHDGSIRRAVLRSIAPVLSANEQNEAAPTAFKTEADVGVPRTLRTGESQIVESVSDAWLATVGANAALREALSDLGIVSLMTTALTARGRIIGAITYGITESGRHFGTADLVRAEDLAARCALALDNAALFGKVEEMNRAKDEFIAMLGHELRNPLAAMSNTLMATAANAHSSPHSLQGAYTEMRRQVAVMSRIIDDLLDVTRVTRGLIRLHAEPMEVGDAVSVAVDSLVVEAAAKSHIVETEVAGSGLRVLADQVRVHQIVTNLLHNAIKYTPPGGRIRVSAKRDGDCITVRVMDNGIGISPTLLPHVFDLFRQADTSLDRPEGGIGIGLTLVKRLVGMHHGSVEAFSAGLGEGSEFVVSLPALGSRPHGCVRHSEPAQAQRPRETLSVLVVDDNAFAGRMLAQTLASSGYQVRVAVDGPEALGMALQSPPDVAIVDIGLPEMDGYELARLLRAEPALAKTRLVALTGYGGDDDRQRSRSAGFDTHLVKPVDYDALERVLQAADE